MASSYIQRKIEASNLVVEVTRTHATRVAPRLAEVLAPDAEACGADISWEAVLTTLGRHLARRAEAMEQAARRHDAEVGNDEGVRERRDAAREALYTWLMETRTVVETAYGHAVAREIGFNGRMPQITGGVLQLGEAVLAGLPNLRDRTPKLAGFIVDLAALIGEAEKRVSALAEAVATSHRERREAQATAADRRAAIAAHDVSYRAVTLILEGCLRLGGEGHLADRVRPRPRKGPSRTADEEVAPLAEGEEAEEETMSEHPVGPARAPGDTTEPERAVTSPSP